MPIVIAILSREDYAECVLGVCEYIKIEEFKKKLQLYCDLHGFAMSDIKYLHTYLNSTTLMEISNWRNYV